MPDTVHIIFSFQQTSVAKNFALDERDDANMYRFSSPTHPLCSCGPTQICHRPDAKDPASEADVVPAPPRPSVTLPLLATRSRLLPPVKVVPR
jgi:hypothetical protein